MLDADKTCKLSLGNPYRRDPSGYHLIYANPGDPFCLVELYEFYFTRHLKPAMEHLGYDDHRFFCHRAPQKILREWKKVGLTCEAGVGHKNYHWGVNQFDVKIKKLAEYCNFDNAESYTMRSNRRVGITKMSGKLSASNVQNSARHKSASCNVLYQQENGQDHVDQKQNISLWWLHQRSRRIDCNCRSCSATGQHGHGCAMAKW